VTALARLAALRIQLARISHIAALVGLYVLLAVAVLVSMDVTVRKVWGLAFVGADEMAGYAMALATSWALSFAFFQGSHIRVNVLYSGCSPRVRAVLDTLAIAAMAGMVALLAWQVWAITFDSWTFGSVSNTPLRVPLWLPQCALLVGILLFLVSAWVVLAEAVLRLRARQYDAVLDVLAESGMAEAGDTPTGRAP